MAVHSYWQFSDPAENAANWVNRHTIFEKPIYVTEAAFVAEADGKHVAQEYVKFPKLLNNLVKGVTYFVATATDHDFRHQVWINEGGSRGIAKEISKLTS